MVDLSYRDQRQDLASGAPSPLSVIADVAKDAACAIYFKSPAAFLSDRLPGTPLLDGQRAFFDNLCYDKIPLPPAPVPPFEGGQCCNVAYNVFVEAELQISDGSVFAANGSAQLTGTIEAVEVENRGSGADEITLIIVRYMEGDLCDIPRDFTLRSTFVRNADGTTGKYVINNVEVTRLDGLPDNCGNPPADYPSGNLTINDFDFNVDVNFSPNFQISVPVTVIPTVVNNVNVFRPELNIKVGDINVNFSLGGITFAPTINLPPGSRLPNFDPRPSPPPAKPNDPPARQKDYTPDFDDIRRRIDDILEELEECCDAEKPFPEPPPQKVVTSVIATGRSGAGSVPSGTYKVTLEITGRPTQEKIQFGLLGSDVLYAGWAWFQTSGAMGERMQVDALEKVFVPPARGGDRFNYTLYAGYSAIIRAYYIV